MLGIYARKLLWLLLLGLTATRLQLPVQGQEIGEQFVELDTLSSSLNDPPSLELQVAELTKRLETLEHPAIKYPANVQVLGVFQADGVTFNQDDANRAPHAQGGVCFIENGGDFRRARLAAKAALANNMNAFMQWDFAAQGRPTFTDVWVEWTDLPLFGNIRVGQWKQPFSLEVVSSFR